MRKLMWFTLGLGILCALCAYTMPDAPLGIAAGVSVMVLLISWLCSKRWRWMRCVSLCCGGALVGLWLFFGFQILYLDPITPADGTTQSITLTASDYSYETDYGIGVDAVTKIGGRQVRVRAYLDEGLALQPGDSVSGEFRLRLTAPNGEKASDYHASTGVFYLAYQAGDISHQPGDPGQLRYLPTVLRQRIGEILRQSFPEDVFPFVIALLLGETKDISYELDTAFRISGIAHLVAVSGMHVSVLYGLIQLLTLRRRFLTALLTIPAVLLFTAVAGFTPSITRASLMIILMVTGQALNREYDAPTALSFSCLVMLCANPFVITSVSFQLSVGCVAGILLFGSRIQSWLDLRLLRPKQPKILNRLIRSFTLSASVTLSSMTLITPLCAYYFGTVSIVGVLTNLLTLWAANFLFYGIIATVPLYLLTAGGAAILGKALAWLARFVTGMAVFLSKLPMAAVYLQSIYILFWLVLCYVLLSVFLFQKKKRPGVLLCCAVLCLCVALLASWIEPLTCETQLTVLDVGQGQAILLQNDSHTVLIDCGGDDDEEAADLVAHTLLSQGIRRLDALIITHPDRDHAGGAAFLLSRIPAATVLLPGTMDDSLLSAEDAIGQTIFIRDNLSFTMGTGVITIYAPPFVSEDNENSLCVLYQSYGCSVLVTGDRSDFGENLLLRENVLPDVDILIAGHHGSKHSTGDALLQTVTPETVIISVSGSNRYGHPAPELLQRLEAFGCQILRTDQMGTIVIRR